MTSTVKSTPGVLPSSSHLICRRHLIPSNHDLLIQRLQHMFGLCGKSLNWIHSYFDDRKSFIWWGSGQSATTGSKIGVPQGSSLGPLPFSLYFAPLDNIKQSFGAHHHQYADDTYLYIFANKDQQRGVDHWNLLHNRAMYKCIVQLAIAQRPRTQPMQV